MLREYFLQFWACCLDIFPLPRNRHWPWFGHRQIFSIFYNNFGHFFGCFHWRFFESRNWFDLNLIITRVHVKSMCFLTFYTGNSKLVKLGCLCWFALQQISKCGSKFHGLYCQFAARKLPLRNSQRHFPIRIKIKASGTQIK